MPRRRYVLLDRDGTLIAEREYLRDPAGVELLPGTAAGLRRLAKAGLGLVVVTNQSGLGRGYFDLSCLSAVHERMLQLLWQEGIRLDGIYYCPHVPDEHCTCRKPQTGMAHRAVAELDIDLSASFVIGDKPCDVEFGRNIGATTFLVRTGYGAQVEAAGATNADYVVNGLDEAAHVITSLI